ncbi:MAG: hypothetical protein Q8O89_00830 [Nanoarchaeota archaeon]|nr:hypothetical protein [Nanoarchaeota archaeon]
MASTHREMAALKHQEAMHKKRQAMAHHYIKEKMVAEKYAHHAKAHSRHAMHLGRKVRNFGKPMSIIAYILMAGIIAAAVYLVGKRYHWF